MLDMMSEEMAVTLVGLGGGLALGLAARLGRFCTLGAIEDWLYGGNDIRMRMWVMAIGVAVVGSFGLLASGYLTGADTYYLSIRWMPLASIVGGLMFGYGMALCGNCGFGALARLGGGDLRSFVIVLVMGVATYVVLSGPLAPLRAMLFQQNPVIDTIPPGMAHYLSHWSGVSAPVIGIVIGLGFVAAALGSASFRADRTAVFWSIIVGLAVVSGWAGTQWVFDRGFDALPVVSHSFSAPVGESILFAMTGSAGGLSFAIGSVAGVWSGAFVGSLIKGHFRWEACEDPRELRRQIIGAAIMGAGAVLALGCTVGQGLSAFSLLAVSAPVTVAAILAGAALGLRQLIFGFSPAE